MLCLNVNIAYFWRNEDQTYVHSAFLYGKTIKTYDWFKDYSNRFSDAGYIILAWEIM